jgi:[protein-PII] uridylyltransferase
MAFRSRLGTTIPSAFAQGLQENLRACARQHSESPAACRAAAKDILLEAIKAGREQALEQLDGGLDGLVTARALSRVVDEIIAALFAFTVDHVFRADNPTMSERLALVAVGGYGRGELAPFSDIDLVFLRPYKSTSWTESVSEFVLYMLWDLKLKVGHSARSIEDCLQSSRGDHTIETALLEARHVAGDAGLFTDLEERLRREFSRDRYARFVAAKLSERDARHQRAGASRFLVEPNVKESKGGLRDLHTLFWLLRRRYGPLSTEDFVRQGTLSAEDARVFADSAQFLWTVRCQLHRLVGRAQERLTFDLQPEMALRLRFAHRTGQPAVERFMKRYFLVAKHVGALTRTICAKLESDAHKRAPSLSRFPIFFRRNPLEGEPNFRMENGRLTIASADLFARQPEMLLRMFECADRHDLDIHPQALAEASANLRRITPALRAAAGARQSFLACATSTRNPARTLKLMNEAGVLGRFIPEFGMIVARTQFNMYHHFTVDEHTLHAIELISEIEAGRLANDHPLASELFTKIVNRRALYLAMLLHDVGKSGADQCVDGAKAAEAACRRLGLPEEETTLVGWLVRHHLLMSEVAQRRDITDPRTVAGFVQQIGALERLRLLLVLTVADIRAVGPGVWNGWKGQLLRDLYRASEAALRGGYTDEAGVAENLAGQAARAKAHLAEALGPSSPRVQDWFAKVGDAYWLSFSQEEALWHASEVARAEQSMHVAARALAQQAITQVLVRAPDRPGLFASLAGVLAQMGADIADARGLLLADGAVFDVFSLRDRQGQAFCADEPERLQTVLQRLREVIPGPGPVAAPRPPSVARRLAVFAVEPWVRLDQEASLSSTVVEVSGRDRPGLLADLAAAIAAADCTIVSAHVDGYGERAADVFYVRENQGSKLLDANKAGILIAALEDVLRVGDEAEPVSGAGVRLAVARASTAR